MDAGEGKFLLVDAGKRLTPIGGCWEKVDPYWWILGKVLLLVDSDRRLTAIGGCWGRKVNC